MNTRTNIKKSSTTTPVTVDEVYASEYQKQGTLTAQLRQVITIVSLYPTKQISNDMQDNIFNMEDFGFEEKAYTNEENRVAWIDVPTGVSVDDVVARLPKTSVLYKVLSNRPILTSSQSYAVDSPTLPETNLDTFGDRQIVRYPESNILAGQIVRDANGKPQYRAIFFSKTAKTDEDLRTSEAEDFYASNAVKAELAGSAHVIQDQNL